MNDTEDTIQRSRDLLRLRQDKANAEHDAWSIKGKVVDDTDIEDGYSLVYDGPKDKIVYERARRGGGGLTLGEGGGEKCASYIIRKNGSYYEAINGSTGQISYGGAGNAGGATGTDAAAVCNAAINGLTVGRTWKETVLLKGNFTISQNIMLKSYTRLLIQGAITCANGATAGGLNMMIGAANNTFMVEIDGGQLDGNLAGGNSWHYGIYIPSYPDYALVSADWGDPLWIVRNVNIRNIYYGIANAMRKTLIEKCSAFNISTGGGFVVQGSDNMYIDCIAKITTGGAHGFDIGEGWMTFLRCAADHCAGNGFNLVTASAGPHDVQILGGYSEYNTLNGIYLGDVNTFECRIRDVDVLNNGLAGIKINNALDNRIEDCRIFDDQGVGATQDRAIEEQNATDYNQYVGNTFGVGNIAAPIFLGAHDHIQRNRYYNPLGTIANPYPVAAGGLLDTAGAQAFPTTATNYTVGQSSKLITIYGGTVTSISIDGVVSGLTSGAFFLNPGQILNVVWTGQPSSVVYAC